MAAQRKLNNLLNFIQWVIDNREICNHMSLTPKCVSFVLQFSNNLMNIMIMITMIIMMVIVAIITVLDIELNAYIFGILILKRIISFILHFPCYEFEV